MNSKSIIISFLLFGILVCSCHKSNLLTLAENGKSDYVIVISANADSTTKKSAIEIAEIH